MSELLEIKESRRGPDRSVRICIDMRAVPAPRQNRGTRWRSDATGERVQEYNNFRATVRDNLEYAMAAAGIGQLRKGPLEFKAEFWFKDKAKLYKGNDLDNLIKAIWDCIKGILITDDCWICREESRKMDGPFDRIVFQVWEFSK